MTVLSFLGTAAVCYAVYCVLPTYFYKWKWLRLSRAACAAGEKTLILTFDDGPDPRYTERVLDVLAAHGVRAVFFVVAEQAERHPALIRRMLEDGHLVGLHSLEHRSAWQTGPGYVKREFERSMAVLDRLGCKVRYYRPPWGQLNLASLFYAEKHGLTPVLWTVMAQDWEKQSTSERVLRRLKSRMKPGAVICLHDAGRGPGAAEGAPLQTIGALPAFLETAEEQDYRFLLPGGGAP